MAAEVVIKVEERSGLGKNASRRLRSDGKIPGVVYGHGTEAISIAVDPKELIDILTSDSGRNTIFTLDIGTTSADVLIKDFQLDPVKGTLLHADFQRVFMDEVMAFEVPIEILGTAKGVEAGGIMDVVTRTLSVECLPNDVPDQIPVQVDELDIGNSIRVSDLEMPAENIKVLTDADTVVLNIAPPRVLEEEEVEEVEEEAAGEPEVIKKGKAEEENEQAASQE